MSAAASTAPATGATANSTAAQSAQRAAAGPPTAALLGGPLLPLLLRLALPNMGAMLATALAAMAETAYVGSFGVPALAGMALVFPMVMFQNMLSAGAMGGGVSSAISRALGAGDTARANALAVHAVWIAVAAGLLTMAAMLAGGPALFALLGGRGQALAQAVAYANVAFLGAVAVWLVNTLASVLRGAGNMALPSAVVIAVALGQVAVGGALGLGWGPLPRWGMAGVAAGQVVANGVAALFMLAYLGSGRARLRLSMRATPLQAALLRDILKVGALASLSPLQTVLTILVLTRLVAQFGPDALAGYGIGARLEFLLVPIAFAIGVASVPLVGMAIGAGQIAPPPRRLDGGGDGHGGAGGAGRRGGAGARSVDAPLHPGRRRGAGRGAVLPLGRALLRAVWPGPEPVLLVAGRRPRGWPGAGRQLAAGAGGPGRLVAGQPTGRALDHFCAGGRWHGRLRPGLGAGGAAHGLGAIALIA